MRVNAEYKPKDTRPSEPILVIIGDNAMTRLTTTDAHFLVSKLNKAIRKAERSQANLDFEPSEVHIGKWYAKDSKNNDGWWIGHEEMGENFLGNYNSSFDAINAIRCAIAVGIEHEPYGPVKNIQKFHALYQLIYS